MVFGLMMLLQRCYMLYWRYRIPRQAALYNRRDLVRSLNLHFQVGLSLSRIGDFPSDPSQYCRIKRWHNLQLHAHPARSLPRLDT